MATHWISKLIIIGGIFYLIFLFTNPNPEIKSTQIILLSGLLLLLVLLEVLFGTVKASERLMLEGKYEASQKEIRGTLFPNFLLQSMRVRFYTIKSVNHSELDNIKLGKKYLGEAIQSGLNGSRLTFALTKVLKNEPQGREKIKSLIEEITLLNENSKNLNKAEYIEKVNQIISSKFG